VLAERARRAQLGWARLAHRAPFAIVKPKLEESTDIVRLIWVIARLAPGDIRHEEIR